jgi:hypothetical protein
MGRPICLGMRQMDPNTVIASPGGLIPDNVF